MGRKDLSPGQKERSENLGSLWAKADLWEGTCFEINTKPFCLQPHPKAKEQLPLLQLVTQNST